MLAWVTIVRDEFERRLGPPSYRHAMSPDYAPCALSGVAALALRTNEADVVADLGLDLLVGPGGNATTEIIQDLDDMCPEQLIVLWDSPTWEPARRHGFEFGPLVMSAGERALMLAVNAIRRDALDHARLLHLIDHDVKSEFAVNVLEPGWAALTTMAQFVEADILARHGVIAKDTARLHFRWAAATVVRSFRAFPETSESFFAQFGMTARVADPAPRPAWHDQVVPMSRYLLDRAGERRTYLMRLPDGTDHQYPQTLAAIRALARAVGVDATINPAAAPDLERGL